MFKCFPVNLPNMRPRPGILMLAFLTLLPSIEPSWFATSPRIDMNFTEMVKFDGYESEWHHITTSDGYVLSVFRVRPHGPCSMSHNRDSEAGSKNKADDKTQIRTSSEDESGNRIQRKISNENEVNNKTLSRANISMVGNNIANETGNGKVPILFAHGMYLSGDDCVTPGPRNAHCYLYADSCHDVWVFNARGSRYSRAHATLDPDTDAQYWNFAFDEMALFDLPATIDFILKQTNQKQIAFIGHSQGAAILMLLCAKKPEYNDKITVGFGLSPSTSLCHYRFVNFKIEEILSAFLLLMDKTGLHFEVFGYGKLSQKLSRFLCSQTKLSYLFCSAVIFSFIGYNKFDISSEVLPVFYGHLPSGSSAKNFLRWGQIVKNGFSEYDYGEEGNLKKYGVKKPPMFDLSKVTMKWMLIASSNDYIADLKDVDITAAQLPNVQKCVLSDDSVGHLDFIFGRSVVKYIVPMIVTALDDNKFVCL